MELNDITVRLTRIDAMKDDDEAAHAEQDKLYEDVLEAIANGAEAPQDLASHVLAVREINFARWFA